MAEDLFGDERPPPKPPAQVAEEETGGFRPLADRLRPRTLEEMLGQEDLLGPDAPLVKLLRAGNVPSMILWGPPGSGKTTLARLVAARSQADLVTLSAVTSSVKDVRAVVDVAKSNRKYQRRTILFIDEIHRFNKAQQDAFLPHVESGTITLVGATTENPSFSVISPLLSRCRVFVLKPLGPEDVRTLLRRGVEELNRTRGKEAPALVCTEEAEAAIVGLSDGDARRALGLLELAESVKRSSGDDTPIEREEIARAAQRHFVYDKTGEEHYNLISALHKTLRSSDPHGAAYWLQRMLAAGEDPRYVARRLIRFASEDVGLADPQALPQTVAAWRAYESLGTPEGELALVQAAVYLAMAPKSNAVYKTQLAVQKEIGESGSLPVPLHLRNAPTGLMKDVGYAEGYTYDHDHEGGFAAKQGLPDEIAKKRFFHPGKEGWEGARAEHLRRWDKERGGKEKGSG